MTATATYRKTKNGEWVVYGPTTLVQAGRTVRVVKRDGTSKSETVARVGRPFTVASVEMVYGYIATAGTVSSSHGACDECGGPGARYTARDMSGLTGTVCGRCYRSGNLSFA